MALTLNGSGTIQADDITLSGNANVTGTMTSTGDLTASAALNATLTGNADSATKLSTASGSAPSYSARAWVNFNGSGTVAIRSSGNVSSITDNGTGNYDVNFTTAMPDANYAVAVTGAENVPMSSARDANTQGAAETSSLANVNSWRGSSQYDLAYMSVSIFR